ncbi:hypothetical protein PAXRUDRAFT_15312 [Paxillus rubicundulus Ve08.2h10]|uniref:Uncharacterized protein n=1 Tax=Paxillus rubicundulus Ve08.2h10 TaxID=930991 RepID=A0A0D0DIC8_9AGAM|nr:hypothetical protein PAXRUDRAFT_15312 [Paxillus rubicundulus Ve08.2h10]
MVSSKGSDNDVPTRSNEHRLHRRAHPGAKATALQKAQVDGDPKPDWAGPGWHRAGPTVLLTSIRATLPTPAVPLEVLSVAVADVQELAEGSKAVLTAPGQKDGRHKEIMRLLDLEEIADGTFTDLIRMASNALPEKALERLATPRASQPLPRDASSPTNSGMATVLRQLWADLCEKVKLLESIHRHILADEVLALCQLELLKDLEVERSDP